MEDPQFESGIPDKPECFDTFASEEWDRITGDLNGQRVFTKNDLGILVAICFAYEQLRETHAILKALGRSYTVEDMGGNTHYKARPECVRFETAQKEYRSLLAEIGFSPCRSMAKRTNCEISIGPSSAPCRERPECIITISSRTHQANRGSTWRRWRNCIDASRW